MRTALKIRIATIKVTTTSAEGVVSSRSHTHSEVLLKVKNGVPMESRDIMMDCTWCGDEMKPGIYEVHRCLEDKEELASV